ncbi:LysR family transcriptional regulator [Vibrio maritimus]|uniref:LysR family transcriptional regulator n=1 Tax=Vibrio maritimus TaxID=990268 RepID=UPI0037367797
MKWQGIEEFVAVAETQSFTAAAKNLSLSTAQVSRQISDLEERLQVKLFYRTTRKVSLTQEAQVYYEHCRYLLDGIEVAEQAVTRHQNEPHGLIKMVAPTAYGEKKLLPLVNDFVAKHHNIEVWIELANHHVDLIEGSFDLAIRIGPQPDSSLYSRRISQRTTHICASPAYLAKNNVPTRIEDLHHHNCLLGLQNHWRFTVDSKEVSVRLHGGLRYNSGVGLLDAALKGIGIVQLSDHFVKPYLSSGELVSLLSNFDAKKEDVWAIYPQNRFLSPKITLLIDHLTKGLAKS